VCEKEDSLTRLLVRYLDGAEIVQVNEAEQALQEVIEHPTQALILNDPADSQTLKLLSSNAALPYGIPVIACAVPGASQAAGDLRVFDYLVKPISKDKLLYALDRLGIGEGTLLIVDDEPDALRLFRRMLTSSGRSYRLLKASDGDVALRILREQHPDAMLLDLVMPNMDGFGLLAEKNRAPQLRDIPVVVISARDPAGQPLVSSELTITQRDGLSVPQLLACINLVSRVLSPFGLSTDRAPSVVVPGGTVCA